MSSTAFTPHSALTIRESGHVAVVEFSRPPHNFFTLGLIEGLAAAFEHLDGRDEIRATVLAASGKIFCAGADFNDPDACDPDLPKRMYTAGLRMFSVKKPMAGAINGPAVGGGLGLALVPDFRVATEDARFSANFSRLGIHCGFGLSATLPHLIGEQKAALLLYTGRRLKAEEALRLGLADVLVGAGSALDGAMELAQEIASSAPLAVQSMRKTLRDGFADRIREAQQRESSEQHGHLQTEDFKEGVAAMTERRTPNFKGR